MSATDNPYQPPTAGLATSDARGVPVLLYVAVALYGGSLLMRFAQSLVLEIDITRYAALTWMGVALVNLLVGIALVRGKGWARAWLVFFTILPVVSLLQLRHLPILPADLLHCAADITRILAAAMLFLPSVRHWFTTRRA